MPQANTPTARPKHAEKSDLVTIRIPKETRDDMTEPTALIHDYLGEDATFKTTELLRETPKFFEVQGKREEMENFNKTCVEEHKDKLKFTEGDKRFKLNSVTVTDQGVSMDSINRMVKDAVQQISDANG